MNPRQGMSYLMKQYNPIPISLVYLNQKKGADLKDDNKGQLGSQDVPEGHRVLVLPRTAWVFFKEATVSERKHKK